MAPPRLLICIGAQKAGTSWLYGYLKDHPDCHMRSIKELHYFNLLGRGGQTDFHRRWRAAHDRLSARVASLPWYRGRDARRRLRDVVERLAMEEGRAGTHQNYLSYLQSGRGRRRLIADITPAYATLGQDTFAEMIALMPDVRILYILRDPVDRVWSQTRMIVRREGLADGAQAARAKVRRFCQRELDVIWRRSEYARTLEDLGAAVPEDRLMVLFYEDLFSPASIQELCAFAGIRYKAPKPDNVVHGGIPLPLHPEDRQRLAAVLRDQYEACSARFGAALPARWRTNMMEV
ncbi:MAG: sulfotransferase [Pseudomonadota bacterium]